MLRCAVTSLASCVFNAGLQALVGALHLENSTVLQEAAADAICKLAASEESSAELVHQVTGKLCLSCLSGICACDCGILL